MFYTLPSLFGPVPGPPRCVGCTTCSSSCVSSAKSASSSRSRQMVSSSVFNIFEDFPETITRVVGREVCKCFTVMIFTVTVYFLRVCLPTFVYVCVDFLAWVENAGKLECVGVCCCGVIPSALWLAVPTVSSSWLVRSTSHLCKDAFPCFLLGLRGLVFLHWNSEFC